MNILTARRFFGCIKPETILGRDALESFRARRGRDILDVGRGVKRVKFGG